MSKSNHYFQNFHYLPLRKGRCQMGYPWFVMTLYSSDHLERKWRKTKAYHIRDTTDITQRSGTEGNLGASHLANISFKLKCQLLEASLGTHSVRIYHNGYFYGLLIWVGPLILYS